MLKHSLVATLALALAVPVATAQNAQAADTDKTGGDKTDGAPSGNNPPQGFSVVPIAPLRDGSNYWPGYLLTYSAPPGAQPQASQDAHPPTPPGVQPPPPPGAHPPAPPSDQSPKPSGGGQMRVCYVIAKTADLGDGTLLHAIGKSPIDLLCTDPKGLP
jgi:hypothetical protein